MKQVVAAGNQVNVINARRKPRSTTRFVLNTCATMETTALARRRASDLGLNMSQYIMDLILEDLRDANVSISV